MIRESELTCPSCGHRARETMPVDSCRIAYECRGCRATLRPKPGDCCVFCSFGSVSCPPIQAARAAIARSDRDDAAAALRRIVYVSAAAWPFDDEALTTLLEGARARNARDGVTGMLLYREGNFMQALEGSPAGVDAAMGRIRADPRHRGLIVVVDELRAGPREFPDWSMGFRRITAAELPDGFTDFLERGAAGVPDGRAHRARRLLAGFRDTMR